MSEQTKEEELDERDPVVELIQTIVDIGNRRIDALEAALRFYADETNWKSPSSGFNLQYDREPARAHSDGGSLARSALNIKAAA
jgi:hypothetical protein